MYCDLARLHLLHKTLGSYCMQHYNNTIIQKTWWKCGTNTSLFILWGLDHQYQHQILNLFCNFILIIPPHPLPLPSITLNAVATGKLWNCKNVLMPNWWHSNVRFYAVFPVNNQSKNHETSLTDVLRGDSIILSHFSLIL